ncbi:MFS transporter [Candidatus Deferrimicrobium sp.]|uniref:MFS transporter n=1 Tax=Candidatus Deferrimicrobium sp. TaxID=3060586 RepID=UPI002ED91A59
MSRKAPVWMSWLMWGLVAGFYLIGFFQRVAPAVMVDELMREFDIGGALLGNLSATYFYSYTVMQIPSGLLADGIGPRRLSAAAALLAAVGTLMFGLADHLWMAYAGRLLVGAAVGVAFVTCMKLAGHWFPANRFATVTGVALLFGNFGGVLAGVPLSEAVSFFGWRTSMVVSAAFTFALAVAVWLVVRDDPRERGFESFLHASVIENGVLPPMRALRSVLARRETWLLLFAGGLSASPVLVFAGLWGVPYLTQVHGIDRSHAAALTSTMLIAWAVGGPALGAMSDRFGRRKLPYLASNVASASLWGVFLFWEGIPRMLFYPLFAAIGFTSGALIIGFAHSREANHPGAAGAVAGVVNMGPIGFAAILQPLLGSILDGHWGGLLVNGARFYGAGAYSAAFLWLFLSSCLSVAAVYFTRETHCRIREFDGK